MCNLLEVVLQSNSPLVVFIIQTNNLVLGPSFQLGVEGILDTQIGVVGRILVRTARDFFFTKVITSFESPCIDIIGAKYFVAAVIIFVSIDIFHFAFIVHTSEVKTVKGV